jgi:hypothetical protein
MLSRLWGMRPWTRAIRVFVVTMWQELRWRLSRRRTK